MPDVVAVALEWAARSGPPNALFVAALLTRPSTWTNRLVTAADRRLSGGTEQ